MDLSPFSGPNHTSAKVEFSSNRWSENREAGQPRLFARRNIRR
jgi:hypothetical protein